MAVVQSGCLSPAPLRGSPTAPRLGGVNGKLPKDLSGLHVKQPE